MSRIRTEMDVEDPRLNAFDFELPAGAIARFPPKERDGGRLLRSDAGAWRDESVTDLVDALSPGDVLIVNDTKVMSARLFGRRSTGGRVEVLLLENGQDDVAAMVRPGRRLKDGESITLMHHDGSPSTFTLQLGPADPDGTRRVSLSAPSETVMASCGRVPLPPYMERPATADDALRYQSVFAREPGAVAAPTASLHLTTAMIAALNAKGVGVHRITLHVGAGTFRNLRPSDLDRGTLHTERYFVGEETAAAIAQAKSRGSAVTAVGTTVTRTLESAARASGVVAAGAGVTDLFIQPGYKFQIVDRLMTNFHLPRSSLLMLTCAFGGRDHVLAGYSDAIQRGYRFYSYGDAMLLEREE